MKVHDTQGRVHAGWPPDGHEVYLDDKRKRSEPHMRVRNLLKDMFPTSLILEEVPLPGENLTCDFYFPQFKIMIEVHGEQHYKFVPHFHDTKLGFAQSKKRDRRKAEWCELNNITLIVLPFSETDDEWRTRIEES